MTQSVVIDLLRTNIICIQVTEVRLEFLATRLEVSESILSFGRHYLYLSYTFNFTTLQTIYIHRQLYTLHEKGLFEK